MAPRRHGRHGCACRGDGTAADQCEPRELVAQRRVRVRRPAWFKDGFGVVHLQGAAKQISTVGTGANRIGTLPKAARPSRNVFVLVHTFAGTYADLEVAKNGNINVIDPRPPAVTDLSFVSLEGITYRKSGPGATAIQLNQDNWSGISYHP